VIFNKGVFMGVDAKLLVNARYGVGEIEKLLTEGLKKKHITTEYRQDHAFIRIEGIEEPRTIYIARSSDIGGVTGTYLSMHSNTEAIDLLTAIARVVGGILVPEDCYDKALVFQDPHAGFARWVLNHQILVTAETDSEKLSDKVAKATGYERPEFVMDSDFVQHLKK
jgi:hypothetical protein